MESIYCHSDGYLSHNGRVLLTSYADERKVRELLALGDLSFLAEEIGEFHDYRSHWDNPKAKKWCLSFKRDRGERDVEGKHYTDLVSWLDGWGCYAYLFREGKWYWTSARVKDLVPLTLADTEED
mgnify:FL=1